jgi:hypothetical protein
MTFTSLPDPPPAPSPFAGPDSYQWQFNGIYEKSRRPELQPFFYGRPGGLSGVQIDPADLMLLADHLYETGVPFDEQIEAWGFDPYATMYMRKVRYGYDRVPVGTGDTNQPPNVVTPADLHGPVVAGYLLVSIDIKDFPPVKG